jgi:hypothetical protein
MDARPFLIHDGQQLDARDVGRFGPRRRRLARVELGSGGGWNDATSNSYPDWVEVSFNGAKTIDSVDVFTVQDAFSSPAEPTEQMTFTKYGVTQFDVQAWDGAAWATVTGGSVTGNDRVWRKVTFAPVTTTKVRVLVKSALDGYSRITEVEAY